MSGERPSESASDPGVDLLPESYPGPVVAARRDHADWVTFPGDTYVIGITVGEEDRAYVVKTLEPVAQHVVNDSFGDLPVSITYCSLRDCPKVFVGRAFGPPLDLRTGGYVDEGGMLLRTGGELYYQESGKAFTPGSARTFPYPVLESDRSTWEAWKEGHPDTSVVYYPTLSTGALRSVYPARQVALPEEAEVVGLTVEGRDRAYLVDAFDAINRYVVCDGLEGESIAVTYCPHHQRAKAFIGPDLQQSRGVSFAGWDARSEDGSMLLAADGELYFQETGMPVFGEGASPFPGEELPSIQTTWKAWREAHPQTSVYLGEKTQYIRLPGREDGSERLLAGLRYAVPFLPAALVLIGLLARFLIIRRRPASEGMGTH